MHFVQKSKEATDLRSTKNWLELVKDFNTRGEEFAH